MDAPLPELAELALLAGLPPFSPSPPHTAGISKKDTDQDWECKLPQLPRRVASSGESTAGQRSIFVSIPAPGGRTPPFPHQVRANRPIYLPAPDGASRLLWESGCGPDVTGLLSNPPHTETPRPKAKQSPEMETKMEICNMTIHDVNVSKIFLDFESSF